MSGDLPSERSACLTNEECQGRCRSDKQCQGICLLNTVHVLQTQNVKADVDWTRSDTAFAFWMQCVSPDTECQGKCRQVDACHCIHLPDKECEGICLRDAVRVVQTQSVKEDVVRMRSVRAFAFRTQCVSYRCRMSRQMSSRRCMPWHLPSRQGVSGHLPSERSVYLPDAECQDRCRPDEECQGICLLDAVRVLQMQNVKADVVRTRSARAFAF